MVLDSVVVDTEHCTFTEYYTSTTIQLTFDRAMNAHDALFCMDYYAAKPQHSCSTCVHGPFPCCDIHPDPTDCPSYTEDNNPTF